MTDLYETLGVSRDASRAEVVMRLARLFGCERSPFVVDLLASGAVDGRRV